MCMYMHYYWHYEHVAGADEAKRNDGLLAERVAPFRSISRNSFEEELFGMSRKGKERRYVFFQILNFIDI